MIQYISKLQNKQTKIKIVQQIINKLNTENLVVRNYTLKTWNKASVNLEGNKYRVDLYVSTRHVRLLLQSDKFTAYFKKYGGSNYYTHDWYPNLNLLLCFTPSKGDLYNILFNTNKRIFFIINSANSKLLQYIMDYKKVTK